MKKIALLGLFVALSTGCGRGWLPLFRGAPCGSRCGLVAPALPSAGCNDCVGNSAGYAPYEGDMLSSSGYYGGGDYYSGAVIDNGGYIENSPSQSMTPVAPAP